MPTYAMSMRTSSARSVRRQMVARSKFPPAAGTARARVDRTAYSIDLLDAWSEPGQEYFAEHIKVLERWALISDDGDSGGRWLCTRATKRKTASGRRTNGGPATGTILSRMPASPY
ncbi:hypothetical protein ACWCXB_24125 [Streptomyces sp. NPDC001514]